MHKSLIAGITDFLHGAALPFRAIAEFFNHPRCMLYALIPIVLCIFFYLAGATLFFYYVTPWLENFLPNSASTSNGWLEACYIALRWLVRIITFIFFLTLFLFTFTMLYMIVAAPFVDQITIEYEREKYGFDFRCPTWREFFGYNWTSMINSARIGLKIIGWTLILFPVTLLLPGPGFLLPALVVGYYFGLTTLIYSSEHRRVNYRDFKQNLHGSRLIVLGMGTVLYLMMLIPFAAIICLPLAVMAGTILYNEDLLKRKTPSPVTVAERN